jgi:hypothetical protein
MVGSKGDLKQGLLGALTAGFIHMNKAHFINVFMSCKASIGQGGDDRQ